MIKRIVVTMFIISAMNGILTANADAPLATPGSVDDPVITKSFFDQNISKKISDELSNQSITEDKVKSIIANELQKYSNLTLTQPISSGNSQNQQSSEPVSTLKVIKLEQGQMLYGGTGTEFIIRTGKTQVISSDENGIADVTTGKDVLAGTTVELNHLLIVPREGRGIKPDPKNKDKQEIYVLIRGSYLLTNTDGTKVTP